MTIYDFLRRLLVPTVWQPYEVAEAHALIDEIERLNIFGTTARSVDEGHEHDYQPAQVGGRFDASRMVCAICGKAKPDEFSTDV